MGSADMIVDASALIAMLRGEPEAEIFRDKLLLSARNRMSPVNLVEARLVAERFGAQSQLDTILRSTAIELSSVDEGQANAAFGAFLRYGKGRHPAALNLGDLFAYALAKVTGEPLLFKGNDFARTDLVPAYNQISDVQSPPG
jgi:ribonuclease VapC